MILMLLTAWQWTRAEQGKRGPGPRLDRIRRQATIGADDSATADLDMDDDQAALDRYNAKLAALHSHDQPRR